MVEYEYAKALFDLAVEEKKTELFSNSLDAVNSVTKEEPDFLKIINSPLIETSEKYKVFDKVFKSLDKTFIEFLKVLVLNNRFVMLEQIIEEYNNLFNDYNNTLNIEVVSNEKLEPSKLKRIGELLKTRYPGKKLNLTNKVSPDILYGIQILCNGESIDMSLKNMLNKLKESL